MEYLWFEIAGIVGGLGSLLSTYLRQKQMGLGGIQLIVGYITGITLFSAGFILLLLDYVS